MIIRIAPSVLLVACVLSALGCAKDDSPSDGPPSSTGAAPIKGASPPATAAAAATAPAKAEGDVDLSPGGSAWAGWTVKGPAGAKVASDGAGGAQVAFTAFQLTIGSGKMLAADTKSGAKAGAEAVNGKVKFTTDTPSDLEYVSELKDVTGADTKMYGFATQLTVGGKPYHCSSSGIANEADLAAAKASCRSLTKK